MAGKKKVKKKVVAKKKVAKKTIKKKVAPSLKQKILAFEDANPQPKHIYKVTTRYATDTIAEFHTLEAAQQCVEANAQLNDLELAIVIAPSSYVSADW